jgi:excisionase family DNA binding protein
MILREEETPGRTPMEHREYVTERETRDPLFKAAREALTPLVYTIPEAAKLLHISENYAYALARDGRLPSVLIGRRRLIPHQQLDEWVQSLTNTPMESAL